MIVFIGMETSGALRTRFAARGHFVVSCDTLPAEDGSVFSHSWGGHLQGDVFTTLDDLWRDGMWPDLAIFHPTCTYLTCSAEWAYNEPDYDRYPGVGYHQRVKPDTLTGIARREARATALDDVRKLMNLPIQRKVIENPVGAISSNVRVPSQIVQPYQFGDDASKKTCLWFTDKDNSPLPSMSLQRDPARYVAPTPRPNGRSYWANQTDTGQNRLSPSDERWKDRSRTYAGIADAMAEQWG